MAKRKTLPKDFFDMRLEKSDEELKEVLDKCQVGAYTRDYSKKTALFFELSEEMYKWLIERGENIEQTNAYKNTPLMYLLGIKRAEKNCLSLIELGANIHYIHPTQKNNMLHIACSSGHFEVVKILIARGIDMNALNDNNETPLEMAYCVSYGYDLIKLAPITEYMVSKGAAITDKMKEDLVRIAKNHEFYRGSGDGEFDAPIDNALETLYELFEVTPVPKRVIHDGVSDIIIKGEDWIEQYNYLWDYLVPASNAAGTVQGEIIRITGRISHEILDNGGRNWDADYRKMLHKLNELLNSGNRLNEDEYTELNHFFAEVKSASTEQFNRQAQLAVKWISLNPKPMKLGKVEYNR